VTFKDIAYFWHGGDERRSSFVKRDRFIQRLNVLLSGTIGGRTRINVVVCSSLSLLIIQ